MASFIAVHRRAFPLITGLATSSRRALATTVSNTPPTPSSSSSLPSPSDPEPLDHYRITLRRSAISLPAKVKGTLIALGIWRRMQTVYHRHNPETAGKILAVKELVEVENVPASAVRTKTEQRHERKAPRGFVVVRNKLRDGPLAA
ncbi:hypothetical protein EWM64_g89 [Hericium alpestre]|uniref:Large ribosomal subunit protein uL30m n=1 Tax=Hericium alpestre TaxID=135208 RepID=A0A4Z0A9X1_9AGAM|nr:hypothetical protein EWM64_g89 [Hericium alpestre]